MNSPGNGTNWGRNPFTIARMRHLDLLALWFRLHPPSTVGTGGSSDYLIAAMTHDNLAALLLSP